VLGTCTRKLEPKVEKVDAEPNSIVNSGVLKACILAFCAFHQIELLSCMMLLPDDVNNDTTLPSQYRPDVANRVTSSCIARALLSLTQRRSHQVSTSGSRFEAGFGAPPRWQTSCRPH